MAEAKAPKAPKQETGKKTKKVKEGELVVEAVPVEAAPEIIIEKEAIETAEPKTVAKAGKRSAKAAKETEEKQAKEVRKADASGKPAEPKKPTPKARSKAERAGQNSTDHASRALWAKLIDPPKTYNLPEALGLATKTSPVKFDATIELHVNLGVDPKQADQNVRDTVVLPAGTGKTLKIAAFVEADDIVKAEAAGADIVGADKITQMLDKESIEFDVLIATPALMSRLGKYARLLGPRGLMPNPKSGTVSADVASAINSAKTGRVEYRVDQAGIIHLGIGKVSFGPDKLLQNAEAVLGSIRAAKPASLKGIYIKSITISSTMGPGIKIQP